MASDQARDQLLGEERPALEGAWRRLEIEGEDLDEAAGVGRGGAARRQDDEVAGRAACVGRALGGDGGEVAALLYGQDALVAPLAQEQAGEVALAGERLQAEGVCHED